jgi:hypothetical protein
VLLNSYYRLDFLCQATNRTALLPGMLISNLNLGASGHTESQHETRHPPRISSCASVKADHGHASPAVKAVDDEEEKNHPWCQIKKEGAKETVETTSSTPPVPRRSTLTALYLRSPKRNQQ